MAEKNLNYNNVRDYKGLEIFLTSYLNQVEYKSDIIILLAHYILTVGLDYTCVVRKSDLYLDDEVQYNVCDVLPLDWNRLSGQYKLTYKKDETIKIVSGMKQNNSFVLYVLKENGDRDQISSSISLKHYIPDEFFVVDHAQYKSLRSLEVCYIMNIITKTILGNKKFEFKKILDSDVAETNKHLQDILLNKDEEVTPNILNDLDDDLNGPLSIPKYKPDEEEPVIGEFYLQDPDRHKLDDVNLDVDRRYYDHPNFIMQEDIDGEPTSSLYS